MIPVNSNFHFRFRILIVFKRFVYYKLMFASDLIRMVLGLKNVLIEIKKIENALSSYLLFKLFFFFCIFQRFFISFINLISTSCHFILQIARITRKIHLFYAIMMTISDKHALCISAQSIKLHSNASKQNAH